ncbi:MAG TPA: 30S ribosomal protein S1, partial [Candidatus Angelobacter sp.]
MSNPTDSEAQPSQQPAADSSESFQDILSQYEKSHSHKPEEGSRRIEATVVTLTADSILLDIGFKTEGILPLTALRPGDTVKPGDKLLVSVKGR